MRTLRFDGESEEAFRGRVEYAALVARELIDAALANRHVQSFIADPELPWTEHGQRMSPTVRVEYAEAVAIGGIGECLAATRSKHWGAGPWIRPLKAQALANCEITAAVATAKPWRDQPELVEFLRSL